MPALRTIAVLAPRSFENIAQRRKSITAHAQRETEKDKLIRVLRAGAYFGEPALFALKGELHRRACSLQALSWVQLQIIRVEDWDRIGQLYPREMQYCRDQVKSHVRQAQYYKSSEAPPAATAKPTPSPTRAADMMAAASSETDWM